MKKAKIISEIDKYHDRLYHYELINSFDLSIKIIKFLFENLKYSICVSFSLFFISLIAFDIFSLKYIIDLKPFKRYIHDCKKLKRYNKEKIYKGNPYLSICIPAYNMEEFIEQNLFSIINQSFGDFEIIIVNDGSDDETENIIERFQKTDRRIKLISHIKKLGVYRSRIESIFNSHSENILFMDPDDMYLNANLFKELIQYNEKNNLDIIEFVVYEQIYGGNKIYMPKNDFQLHYHNFQKNIIYQPELSNLLYYNPMTKEYSHTICRNIWNKLIKKYILIKTYEYIGNKYYFSNIITADDMLMNIISYQYANNFSNINLPGYLYIKRKNSMSRGGNKKLKRLRVISYVHFFKIFYKYIKDYNKDRNILYYEMLNLEHFLYKLKEYNMSKFVSIQVDLIKKIQKDSLISTGFFDYLENLKKFYQN